MSHPQLPLNLTRSQKNKTDDGDGVMCESWGAELANEYVVTQIRWLVQFV